MRYTHALTFAIAASAAASTSPPAVPPPDLHIPTANTTVSIRLIDTTARLVVPMSLFVQESIPGNEKLNVTSLSYLIEHPSGRKFIFDLGMRQDWENLAPLQADLIKLGGWDVSATSDVKTILETNGISSSSIESIILSHWHYDHIGDPSKWDPSVSLIVGPGFHLLMPGYPLNPLGVILESDYKGREVIEMDFDNTLTLGQYQAKDFFGDGSLYLLNTPGHAIGHISALARVTTNPDSFVMLAGDVVHHGGELRPSIYQPLPDEILPNPLNRSSASPCPGELFKPVLHNGDYAHPIYTGQLLGIAADPIENRNTISKAIEFDAHADIFFIWAHNTNLLDTVDLFPKYINNFLANDWVEKTKWQFLGDFAEAIGQQ